MGFRPLQDGQGYSSLVYLALNDVSATGEIPDLSSYTSLILANFYDNDFTTYTGPIGGTSLSNLALYDNPNLTGDLAATFAGGTGLAVVRSENTMLTGGLELVTSVELEGGANKTMVIEWTPAAGGLTAASHLVEYTDDNGASWTALPLVTTGSTVTTGTLGNGTYGVKVTPKASGGAGGTPSYAANALVINDSGSSAGTGTGAGEETGGGTGGGSTDNDSGGGAVFWLLGLPLLFGFRRRK